MSIHIRVYHLPTGEHVESVNFKDEQLSELASLIKSADRLNFDTCQGHVFIPPGVLDNSIILIRKTI